MTDKLYILSATRSTDANCAGKQIVGLVPYRWYEVVDFESSTSHVVFEVKRVGEDANNEVGLVMAPSLLITELKRVAARLSIDSPVGFQFCRAGHGLHGYGYPKYEVLRPKPT